MRDTFLKSRNIWISLILAILVACSYALFFKKIEGNLQKVSAISAEVKSQDEKEAFLRLAGKSILETEDERRSIEELFISPEGVVIYIETLERLANASGASLEIETLELKNGPTELTENVSVRLIATGKYSSVRDFLHSMHELKVASRWHRVSITKMDDEPGVSGWALSMELDALKLK